jgi:hexulose-6-phosphate isomerase
MHIDIFKNTKVRINTAEKLLKKLIISKNLGAFSTIVVPLVDLGKPIFSDDWDYVIKMFYNLTPILKEQNSKIVFELSLNPENQLKFINNFESNNFGINYDIGNSASLGWNPSIEISTLGSVIKHIHIKDRRLNGLTVPLGEGDANFEQISTALRQIHYKGNYTLQCARVPEQSEIMTIQKYIDYVIKIGLI